MSGNTKNTVTSSFQVLIERTNTCFTVLPGETVLAAAIRQDIFLPWACGQGICGTCMGQVVSGTVSYPQGWPLALFESDAEQGQALFCVCQPSSDLVLDSPEL